MNGGTNKICLLRVNKINHSKIRKWQNRKRRRMEALVMKAREEMDVSILVLDLSIQKNWENLTKLPMQLVRLMPMMLSLVKQMANWMNEASDWAAPKGDKEQQKWTTYLVSQINRKEVKDYRVVDNWTQLKRALEGDKVDRVVMHRARREQERSAAREER